MEFKTESTLEQVDTGAIRDILNSVKTTPVMTVTNSQGTAQIPLKTLYTRINYRYKRGKSGKWIFRRTGKNLRKMGTAEIWGTMQQVQVTTDVRAFDAAFNH